MPESSDKDVCNLKQQERAFPWSTAGILLAILLLITFIFNLHTVNYISGLWGQLFDGEYAHGYLVLGISCYLLWHDRLNLAKLKPCPSAFALLGVLVACMLMLVSTITSIQSAQALSLLLVVMVVIWLVLGDKLALRLAFPILFIAFALPIWFPFSPLLQELTADAVFWLARVFNIAAYREHNVIMLPAGSLSIEEACSGLRYLMAALTLGALYARLNYTGLRAQSIVIFVSVCAAILANIIRVYVVVYFAYKTDMQHPWVDDHLNLGWYIFGAVMLVLLLLDAGLHKITSYYSSDNTAVSPRIKITQQKHCEFSVFKVFLLSLAAIIFLGLVPVVSWKVDNQSNIDPRDILIALPNGDMEWSGPNVPVTGWKPVFHGAIDILQSYTKNDETIEVYVGHYPVQRQGKELINVLNRISNFKVWSPVYSHPKQRTMRDRSVLEQVIENRDGETLLVWYWYEVADKPVINTLKAKFMQFMGLLTGQPGASVIAIASQWSENPSEARKILNEFSEFIETKVEIRRLQSAG